MTDSSSGSESASRTVTLTRSDSLTVTSTVSRSPLATRSPSRSPSPSLLPSSSLSVSASDSHTQSASDSHTQSASASYVTTLSRSLTPSVVLTETGTPTATPPLVPVIVFTACMAIDPCAVVLAQGPDWECLADSCSLGRMAAAGGVGASDAAHPAASGRSVGAHRDARALASRDSSPTRFHGAVVSSHLPRPQRVQHSHVSQRVRDSVSIGYAVLPTLPDASSQSRHLADVPSQPSQGGVFPLPPLLQVRSTPHTLSKERAMPKGPADDVILLPGVHQSAPAHPSFRTSASPSPIGHPHRLAVAAQSSPPPDSVAGFRSAITTNCAPNPSNESIVTECCQRAFLQLSCSGVLLISCSCGSKTMECPTCAVPFTPAAPAPQSRAVVNGGGGSSKGLFALLALLLLIPCIILAVLVVCYLRQKRVQEFVVDHWEAASGAYVEDVHPPFASIPRGLIVPSILGSSVSQWSHHASSAPANSVVNPHGVLASPLGSRLPYGVQRVRQPLRVDLAYHGASVNLADRDPDLIDLGFYDNVPAAPQLPALRNGVTLPSIAPPPPPLPQGLHDPRLARPSRLPFTQSAQPVHPIDDMWLV